MTQPTDEPAFPTLTAYRLATEICLRALANDRQLEQRVANEFHDQVNTVLAFSDTSDGFKTAFAETAREIAAGLPHPSPTRP